MTETTFAEEIEELTKDIKIEAVIIGEFGWGGSYREDEYPIPKDLMGVVMSWEVARPLLDYEWERGYGSPSCHAVAIYTTDYIFMVYQYDGATGFFKVFRNPIPHMPEMPGG